MADPTSTAEAPAKQSYLETQLSEAVTSPSERQKLNASMNAYFDEIDAGGSASPEPVTTQAEPAAIEAEPAKQPVAQIALQPAQPPPDPDPMDAQAKQMEVLAHITRHPDYKREKVATQRAYHDCIEEMAKYFDAPAEKIKADFLDPLKQSFTPEDCTDQWFEEQADLMKKASPIMRRKIEAKWLEMRELQARQNKKAQELAQNYDSEQQQRANKNWETLIRAEATNALDEERAFEGIKNLRDRANAGDQRAKVQFDALERDVFRPFMVDLMTEHPDTPPGTATRKALRHVRDHMQGKGQKQTTAAASQPSPSPSQSGSSHKPLPKNAKESLLTAFDQWTPPPRADGYFWDALTNSYKPRAR